MLRNFLARACLRVAALAKAQGCRADDWKNHPGCEADQQGCFAKQGNLTLTQII